MATARTIMVGGFLGAGKTTAILALARHLDAQGVKVGLITNDQSVGLVDTRMAASGGFPVEEITGGCFCCKFNSLIDAADKLDSATRPDVFLMEPVGSCTDLQATVSLPMSRIYGERFDIAPLSVLVDPLRALRVLGIEAGRSFSSKVLYVYEKQLEEAEVIVINKVDLLDEARLAALEAGLAARFPKARIFVVSAREERALEPWFDCITRETSAAPGVPEVDYDIYAEGEARLGWFNARVELDGDEPFDGNAWLRDLAAALHERLEAQGLEVAHLKMTLSPSELGGDLGVINLVRGDSQAELSHALHDELEGGELLINLRAEGDATRLEAAVREVLAARAPGGAELEIAHVEAFQPARPVPTHRLS